MVVTTDLLTVEYDDGGLEGKWGNEGFPEKSNRQPQI